MSTRSSLQAKFPAQVHDVKAAIRWLRVHAREYRIDPSRFAVMGDSSGGWTATMAGVTDCHNDPRSPESLLVGCPIQSCPSAARAANPITYVSRNDPPFLIAHGQADALVPHHQSELLFRPLKARCVAATFYSVPDVGHSREIVSPANPPASVTSTRNCHDRPGLSNKPTLTTIESFLNHALRPR